MPIDEVALAQYKLVILSSFLSDFALQKKKKKKRRRGGRGVGWGGTESLKQCLQLEPFGPPQNAIAHLADKNITHNINLFTHANPFLTMLQQLW